MEKKTPLYEQHVACGGKIVPFAGYLLPIQYSDVIEEHVAVREHVGLFDVSHMGEVIIQGPDALKNLNNLFSNDFTSMTDGRIRYSPMCNEGGGIVDDMLIYRMAEDRYMLVPNASNREKVIGFIRAHLFGDVQIKDISDTIAQMALQGPKSKEILQTLAAEEDIPAKYYTFTENVLVGGVSCILSQTGYTGEHGYEFYCSTADAEKLWNSLMEAGKAYGLIPCGLGARDTLRLEASMPLYGHEMSDVISPLEAGLDFAVKMQKPAFIGKKALEDKGPPKVTRVGLKVTGRGIIREECAVYAGDQQIGTTTSGTYCPYLKGAYAMALVDISSAAVGTKVQAEVRGRKIDAEIVSLPFYKKGE